MTYGMGDPVIDERARIRPPSRIGGESHVFLRCEGAGGLLPAGAAGTSADRFVSMVYSQLKGGQ